MPDTEASSKKQPTKFRVLNELFKNGKKIKKGTVVSVPEDLTPQAAENFVNAGDLEEAK